MLFKIFGEFVDLTTATILIAHASSKFQTNILNILPTINKVWGELRFAITL